MSDAVNKPVHYNQGSIECIEAMKIVLTPEEFRGYLKGNVFKYLWREKDKNGNEDLRKGKSYYDRLIELIDEHEQQKASDLQSLKDHPFGKLKTASLNSDTIPEGHRKLNDSSEEPRQLGDLRWSVAEKRYVEISVDEIGYANRDNWAACRKVEPTVKQSLTTEPDPGEGYQLLSKGTTKDLQPGDEWWHHSEQRWGDVFPTVTTVPCSNTWYRRKVRSLQNQTEPPDGWRFLEVGEVIRNGDQGFENGLLYAIDSLIGMELQAHWRPIIRRNRFEVGEKVVHGDCKSLSISVVENILGDGWVDLACDGVSTAYHVKDLAPYIEDAGEVTGEVTEEVKPPDGWRWLERGELIRNGDKPKNGDAVPLLWIGTPCCNNQFILRRNRFEVGEKVVDCRTGAVLTVQNTDKQYPIVFVDGVSKGIESKHLATYIEDAK